MTPFAVLQVSLDESSDQRTEEVYCVSAFLTSSGIWKVIEKRWLDRLAQDGIDYFRASDCRSVKGPFKNLIAKCGSLQSAKVVAAEIRRDLEAILLDSQWIGFSLGIIMPDYRKVLATVPAARIFYAEDPTVAAYRQMFYEVAQSASENAPQHLIAYLVDSCNRFPKIADTFAAARAMYPALGKRMAAVAPLDDKLTPSLQIADLLASITRDLFTKLSMEGTVATEPITNRWQRHIESFGIWDEQHMIGTILESLKGNLGPIPQPSPSARTARRQANRGITGHKESAPQ